MIESDVDLSGALFDVKPVDRTAEDALDEAANKVKAKKDAEIDKTYSRPIPKSKNGKPKWTRSGSWREDQTIQGKPGERIITNSGKSAVYEGRLADLPTGKDGINRSNPAGEKAMEDEDKLMADIETAIFRNWGI